MELVWLIMLKSKKIVRVRGMPWPKTSVTHYHAQLGLIDKVRAINLRDGCMLKILPYSHMHLFCLKIHQKQGPQNHIS